MVLIFPNYSPRPTYYFIANGQRLFPFSVGTYSTCGGISLYWCGKQSPRSRLRSVDGGQNAVCNVFQTLFVFAEMQHVRLHISNISCNSHLPWSKNHFIPRAFFSLSFKILFIYLSISRSVIIFLLKTCLVSLNILGNLKLRI